MHPSPMRPRRASRERDRSLLDDVRIAASMAQRKVGQVMRPRPVRRPGWGYLPAEWALHGFPCRNAGCLAVVGPKYGGTLVSSGYDLKSRLLWQSHPMTDALARA